MEKSVTDSNADVFQNGNYKIYFFMYHIVIKIVYPFFKER